MNKDTALDNRELDDEERHFKKLNSLCRTMVDGVDEFEYLRGRVQ